MVCDFFLWGYLRHDQQPNNPRQLREVIVAECCSIDQEIIQQPFDSVVTHARLRIRTGGYHFPNELLFHYR